MLSLDDPRWTTLQGAYRVPYDPRRPLINLENGRETESAWQELWQELHHQGDVDEASYAAVPHLVRIHANRRLSGWNVYALIAVIEDVRPSPGNPPIPSWLQRDYARALHQLGDLALSDLREAKDPELVRSIIAILAMAKGQPALARFAIRYTDDERREILASTDFD